MSKQSNNRLWRFGKLVYGALFLGITMTLGSVVIPPVERETSDKPVHVIVVDRSILSQDEIKSVYAVAQTLNERRAQSRARGTKQVTRPPLQRDNGLDDIPSGGPVVVDTEIDEEARQEVAEVRSGPRGARETAFVEAGETPVPPPATIAVDVDEEPDWEAIEEHVAEAESEADPFLDDDGGAIVISEADLLAAIEETESETSAAETAIAEEDVTLADEDLVFAESGWDAIPVEESEESTAEEPVEIVADDPFADAGVLDEEAFAALLEQADAVVAAEDASEPVEEPTAVAVSEVIEVPALEETPLTEETTSTDTTELELYPVTGETTADADIWAAGLEEEAVDVSETELTVIEDETFPVTEAEVPAVAAETEEVSINAASDDWMVVEETEEVVTVDELPADSSDAFDFTAVEEETATEELDASWEDSLPVATEEETNVVSLEGIDVETVTEEVAEPEEASAPPVFAESDESAFDVDEIAGMLASEQDDLEFEDEAQSWGEPIPEGVSVQTQPVFTPEEFESATADPGFSPGAKGSTAFPTANDMMGFQEETISVDFPDEEIRTIIRQVADLYELNVVIPDTLVGATSIKLRSVTWRQVFDVVLEPIGYTYVEDRNIITIKSRDELLQEPTDTRVFIVNYAGAGDLQAAITPLIDAAAGGRIQVDRRSNSLVITERPSRFNNIQEIIQRLDRPTPQVMIESKFIEISETDIKTLGVKWDNVLKEYSLTAGPFQRSYISTEANGNADTELAGGGGDPDNPALSVEGEGDGFSEATGFIDGNQIATLRTEFNTFTETLTESVTDTAVFSADAFNLVVSALKELDDSKIVSNPTVVTLNNTEALINIGVEFPIPKYNYNDERGTFEISGFEYKPIGIILKVTPQVNSAGFINLKIRPEVSSIDREVSFGGASGASIPVIKVRKTESDITIKDGFTLAIGGLVTEDENIDSSKVPILGDLPLLGRVFRHKSETRTQTNLVIFITAKTLNPDGSTYEDVIDPMTLHRMGITDADLPGYVPPESELDLYRQIRDVRYEQTQQATQEVLVDTLQELTAPEEPVKRRRR